MVSIELWMARTIGFMVLVRSHPLRKDLPRVCGARWTSWKRQPRCLLRLGLGRRHHNLLTDSNGNSRMRNLPWSSGTWKSEVARRHRRRWLLRRLIPYSTVAPARKFPNLRQIYVSSWRKTRGGWIQSAASSNHHRLVRVLKRLGSNVPRTRGRGGKDKPSLTAIWSLVWDRQQLTADITFLQQGYKPKDKDKGSEKNKQFNPGGKGQESPLWNAAVTLSLFFWGERWAMGGSLLELRVFCWCVHVCSVL